MFRPTGTGRIPVFFGVRPVMREVAEKSLETLRTSEHLPRPQELRAISQRGQAARDVLMKKAREIETAAHIDDWVSSQGLQPPK